jgi:hypothetical protein
MRTTLAVAIVLAALVVGASVAHAADSSLEGLYTAEGQNPDGTPYRELVKIVRHGDSFLVAWLVVRMEDEEMVVVPRAAGVGVVNGGMLAVSYYGQDDLTGVVLYQIENGGQRLAGHWVVANGDGAIHTETLTRLPTPVAAPGPAAAGAEDRRLERVIGRLAGHFVIQEFFPARQA